ncbi:MAG: DNA polymerase III subunit delta [Bacteroidales bacterium]|nr:DNA polymerase III subunit delta [Bacteroidales bacterium]
MANLTYEQIIQELQKKIYKPIYFLMGDEPFFIDSITDFIEENILTENEKTFNLTVVYGKDIDLTGIVSLAKRYPMMANYQVVVVREAQNIRNLDASEIGKKINPLLHYAQDPLPSTILVLAYKDKRLEKNRKLYKAIDNKGVIFDSKKIYEDKLPAWITAQFKQRGKQIDPSAALLMADSIGNNLSAIINEINKMIIFLENEKNIRVEHVEKLIGVSKEFTNAELLKAIGKKNTTHAHKIVLYFASNPKDHPFQETLMWIFNFFQKLLLFKDTQHLSDQEIAAKLGINPYFLNDYKIAAKHYTRQQIIQLFHTIREYDLKSKGVDNQSEPQELLKEFISKIIYTN